MHTHVILSEGSQMIVKHNLPIGITMMVILRKGERVAESMN